MTCHRIRHAFAPAAVLVAALVAAAAACTKVTTAPDTPISIELVLPSPSIVGGDSLRDTLGVAVPLRAIAFNASGDTLSDAAVRFISLDTVLHVDSLTGLAYASAVAGGSARIVVSAGTLQTLPQTIALVPAPTGVGTKQDSIPTVRYLPPDNAVNAERNSSLPESVTVFHRDATTGDSVGVRRYLVSFAVTDAPDIADSVGLVDETGKASSIDTTDENGVSSRRVRVHPKAGASATGSVTITATVRYLGAILGTPVQLAVPLTPGP